MHMSRDDHTFTHNYVAKVEGNNVQDSSDGMHSIATNR